MTTVYDGNNNPITIDYDTNGRVESFTDAMSRTISFEFDVRDRLTRIYFDEVDIKYTYDVLGNLETLTDSHNKVTRFYYDEGTGDLVGILYPDLHVRSIGYDSFGRVAISINDDTISLYNYNSNGDLSSEEERINNSPKPPGWTPQWKPRFHSNGKSVIWIDPQGNSWHWDEGSGHAPHWDVQNRDGLNIRIYVDGNGNLICYEIKDLKDARGPKPGEPASNLSQCQS